MHSPIRTLLMVRALDLGGSERQLSILAKNLDRSEFDVRVGCLRGDGARARELRASGVEIVEFPVTSFVRPSVLTGAYRMVRYLAKNDIQLVHTFDWPMNVFGVPVARAFRDVVVVSSQRAHRELSPGLPRHLLRLTDRLADTVVVNCDFVKRHLVDEERVEPSRIQLCYNGIDLAAFAPKPRSKPAEFEGAPLVIGIVCAVRPEKGLDTLIDAFGKIRGEAAGVKLAIVGNGPSSPELQTRAASLGLGDRVLFLAGRDNVADVLRGIDIFVLPSLSEAFSNSLMEAMACGCCAVASTAGGNPELVSHGETGLLFPPRDADALASRLRLLIENQELRGRLAEAGSRRIQRDFSQEASARRMAEIYRLLLLRR